MKLISIILPTFNGEKYIEKSIESCLAQSYENIELIIVDDCSTDTTSRIIEQFQKKDHRVKVVTNPQNFGLPKSLNIGFANAKGSFFTWTSDDNYFSNYTLEKLAAELENKNNADIVYSSYTFIDSKNNILDFYGGEPERLIFNCIVGPCFLYKKEVHDCLNGYSESKFRAEDIDFWLRAAAKFRLHYLDQKDLYYYRKHNSSLSFSIYSEKEILDKYWSFYSDSYKIFFNDSLNAGFSDKDIQLHIELFFETLVKEKNIGFDISDKLLLYIRHLDRLRTLNWGKIFFNETKISDILIEKRDQIVSLIVNDLVFDNKVLSKKNPKIAKYINKPISWYYREYEVLPLWYKRFGHIIKMFQRNKPWRR